MPAVQARHAAPLLPATPAADILGVDAADDKRPPLGLPCEPATRRLGSAAPTGCRAQLYVRWKHRCLARSTLALVHGQGLATSSLSRGVELRLLSPSAREQSDPSNLSAFFGRRRQHTPQDFTEAASGYPRRAF